LAFKVGDALSHGDSAAAEHANSGLDFGLANGILNERKLHLLTARHPKKREFDKHTTHILQYTMKLQKLVDILAENGVTFWDGYLEFDSNVTPMKDCCDVLAKDNTFIYIRVLKAQMHRVRDKYSLLTTSSHMVSVFELVVEDGNRLNCCGQVPITAVPCGAANELEE
jgi:hypothetical protein